MADLELIINLLIIILLVPTILYTYRLNKSLIELRQNQKSLAELVAALNEATFKAENSIPKLKTETQHSTEGLKEVVDSAKEIKNDLLFINERADSLADRLENVISSSRTPKETPPQRVIPNPNASKDEREAAEMELLKALRSLK